MGLVFAFVAVCVIIDVVAIRFWGEIATDAINISNDHEYIIMKYTVRFLRFNSH